MTEATATPHRSDLAARIASGAAMLAVALAAIWLGGFSFWLLVSAASIIMLIEWSGLVGVDRWQLIFALVGLALVLLAGLVQIDNQPAMIVMLTIGVIAVTAVATRNPMLAAGVGYAGFPALALLAIRADHNPFPDTGFCLTLWTMAIVWATDIGAFFAGRRFGGLKLAPTISPSKTWSGLLGGMLAAGLVGAALGVGFDLGSATRWLGIPLAVVAQAGDLFESALKRRAGVKDSGRLLPGHGGVLDRLDGLVPVASLAALLLLVHAL
jgi:phosphatidate cytidylyltransferase